MTSNRIRELNIQQDLGETNEESRQTMLETFSNFRVENTIKYKGYLNEVKSDTIIRILSINVNRLRPDQKEKMQ